MINCWTLIDAQKKEGKFMGNGYKGVMPNMIGRERLYLEVTGVQVSSEAYDNLCNWFNQGKTEPRGKAQCLAMQQEMLKQIFPNMLETAELAEYVRQVFADEKAVLAELVIRRYGLDTENGECRKMAELVPEIAREFNYAESTVKTMLPKALDALRRDDHFREALQVPELSDSLFNYWQFALRLLMDDNGLMGYAGWQEQMFWTEEKALLLAKALQQIGVKNLSVLDQTIENWLSVLPEEARLAAKLRYGLGYPLIGRSEDYIVAASGFGEGRNLLNFLALKLNRAALCAILGVEIADVNYVYWYHQIMWPQDWQAGASQLGTLGLSKKVVEALCKAGIDTVGKLQELDMFSEEEQPWSKQVSSKYWPEIVQAWIDLRIKNEVGEYQFDGGGYAYQNVS